MSTRHASKRWLTRQRNDRFVKSAQLRGFRSRALFKLQQLQERDLFLEPGMTVVDLGAAPGGWSQYLAQVVGERGRVVACDILPMSPIEGVEFIQGDFTEDLVLETILAKIGERQVDVVLSDMAPNFSGMKAIDIPKSLALAKLAEDLASRVLKSGGALVIKVFHGAGTDQFIKTLRTSFSKVCIRKPEASRAESREVYVIAKGYELQN